MWTIVTPWVTTANNFFLEIHYAKFVQPNSKLTAIFLDPLGYHLLLAFAARNKEGSPELVYLHRKSIKLKPVTKSKNYEVTEVGWNYENKSQTTTGPILLGTSQGHILETELEAESDKMFTASQQYWRQVRVQNICFIIKARYTKNEWIGIVLASVLHLEPPHCLPS